MTELPTYDHLTNQDLLRLYAYHDSRLVQALLERLEMAERELKDLENAKPLPQAYPRPARPHRT